MLYESIKEDIKKATLARDLLRLAVLRDVVAKCTNELVAKGRKPNADLTDEETLAVIKRAVKQRMDSIEQYRKGNREDLAKEEEEELSELKKFLPAAMSREEIKTLAEKIMKEHPSVKGGQLVGLVMKASRGKADPSRPGSRAEADGAEVKAVVEALG